MTDEPDGIAATPSDVLDTEIAALVSKFAAWANGLTDRERLLLDTARAATADQADVQGYEYRGAVAGGTARYASADIPSIGPQIGAVLAQLSAVILLIGQIQATSKNQEAGSSGRPQRWRP